MRRAQALIGGYHLADKHDEAVKTAAEFALIQLGKHEKEYKGFSVENVDKVSIARAEKQVSEDDNCWNVLMC